MKNPNPEFRGTQYSIAFHYDPDSGINPSALRNFGPCHKLQAASRFPRQSYLAPAIRRRISRATHFSTPRPFPDLRISLTFISRMKGRDWRDRGARNAGLHWCWCVLQVHPTARGSIRKRLPSWFTFFTKLFGVSVVCVLRAQDS
jgi:hypothetical protein